MRKLLPAPFMPKLHQGHAIAGICLIRLEDIRPSGLPPFLGLSSENAAHRVAVEWKDSAGEKREGVFIWRRDTGSRVTHLAGGRLFPGEHHASKFCVMDDGVKVDLKMDSFDGDISVHVVGQETAGFPKSSCFASLAESSRFFERGCIGYSVRRNGEGLDGLELSTSNWRVKPFAIEEANSSLLVKAGGFPDGSIKFDHALVMRDILHEWHGVADMKTVSAVKIAASKE
jgi:hypothetical protein